MIVLQNARSDAADILDKRMAAEGRSASPRDHFQAIRWRETEVEAINTRRLAPPKLRT
jgi:hypothetical protein